MDSLPEYLGELHGEGSLDSSGHFTVAFHALSKLRAFQLANPDYYTIRLVVAGVALGATQLQGVSTKQSFELLMRSVQLGAEEMSNLFEQLLSRPKSVSRPTSKGAC